VVAALLRDLVHNDLARGERPLELGHFDADYSPHIAHTMFTLIDQIATALHATPTPTSSPCIDLPETAEARASAISVWGDLLAALVMADDPRAYDIATDALAHASSVDAERALAVRAGRILLRHDPARFWQPTSTAARTDTDFGRELALACASRDTRELILGRLDEHQLADNHRWLTTLFPPTTDPDHHRRAQITPLDEIHSWRLDCIRTLGQRATRASMEQLRQLAHHHPDDLEIAAALINARRRVQATQWADTTVDNITEILTDPNRRLIRSNTELAKLLLDTLTDIAHDLPAHGELLWNHTPTRTRKASGTTPETWAPKFEAALSAYLAHELTTRLHGRGIVVNREVLVHPRDAYGAGDRTDILVQTTTRPNTTNGTTAARQFTVVIEVKPTWNRDLTTSQETQLVRRYLPEANTDTGIYLVGHYPLDQWTAQDYRKNHARTFSTDILIQLQDQARRLNEELSIHTTPFIMTIPRPQPAQDS
jgi:hypothetical protein